MDDDVARPLPLLGAYALEPADPAEARALYEGVAALGVGGLELPLPAEPLTDAGVWDVDPAWDLLVTCIPTVMGRLAHDAAYGLASADDDGRDRAVADVARAASFARRLADRAGRARVVGIEVHSAPGPREGSTDALTRSLDELVAVDLAGARLLVEHCDERVGDRPAAKGFLPLADELDAVARAAGVGVAVNWGRSAIEGRSTATPVEHVRAARAAGVLGAVVLSGATDAPTAWGDAWGDAHIPPRGDDPALAASAASLLGVDEVRDTLAAAGPATLVAVKVSVRPRDASVEARLAVARASLGLVAAAREVRERATREGAQPLADEVAR
ncbi:DUF4862 family protein [Cellulomonas carbonis]|uniref:UDP-N-acetylglucosamine diphosphorylase n=1 Tax=Cellulomonas carbonis T26 TaxID=947969 RepID=A0A0A0BNT0_9CELL|nr:DUF4862 family protein [Cellulomonas carbonis]KGM10148.1 UDP-N-acetylglucosamine diphosphorylase [Cellulomonas carbonis T26]GGC08574.1 hypothetical protein GCM10010972_22320 [Cellulomonas carbonis]